jgi:hypothetical protein
MPVLYEIVYHTDYATDQLPTNQGYIMPGSPVSPAYCVELSEEGKTFEGWYYTPTYDEGTKIILGETIANENMANWYAKWSVISVNAKMTALADEIRVLSGTTGAMGLDAMATNVGEANDEIDTQATKIAEISALLEGKAVSGTHLDGNIETCILTVNKSPDNADILWYVNENMELAQYQIQQSAFSLSIAKNTIFIGGSDVYGGDNLFMVEGRRGGVRSFAPGCYFISDDGEIYDND